MVDDEPAVLEVLSAVVEDLGHSVIQAKDGREALRLAREHLPQLIVTDHMMPGLSGLDFCREVRKDGRLRDTPIILLSAVLSQGSPDVQAFLAKPFELADFESLVERMLAGRGLTPAPTVFRPPEPRSPEAEANAFLLRLAERVAAATKTLRDSPAGAPEASRALAELDGLAASVTDAAKLAQGQVRLELQKTDLKAFLGQQVAELRARHPELEVTLSMPERPAEVDADRARLRQLLTALFENAARHGTPPPKVSVELELTPSLAVVKVTDQGRGILVAEQRALFQRFGNPMGDTAGLGTGLFITAELARLHGGTLAVRSSLGSGATFSLGLPRARVE